MKIRPSIRLYFLVAMLFVGSATIGVLTITGIHYFFAGLDTAMTEFMRAQATELPLGENDEPVQFDDVTLAAKWEDLPIEIQQNLNPDELIPNELLKRIDGVPVISEPEAGYFAMKVVVDGKTRYISLLLKQMDMSDKFENEPPPFIYIIFIGLGAIVFFLVALILVQRKIASPVEELKDWAKGLDKEQLTKPVPNFHYSELNTLGELIKSSLSSVQESLEREQRFLGYASHELRTPIAVTRTNSELLRKMITKQIPEEKQLEVLDRIERAGFTMTDLTETLLWLNRQEGKSLPSFPVSLGKSIEQIVGELGYLLQGKSVEVTTTVDQTTLQLPEGLCRIVISNLIRNAFQHTENGHVEITQSVDTLSIVNRDVEPRVGSDDLGFGLGLELTQRLIAQYGWTYQTQQSPEGWRVDVTFKI
ncbi:HAMP domain-containing sensor histidine kinase [Vibrio sp. Isolate30]|uniref:sensor histidine kinase n=1 Tax=Vibrio sp. Isolate30 TaxID=2908536 RepID=UPI001EFD4E3C|nr:HAMP domain-containing sensor histidine kinase [Vibrio sp. Isolate30]MCG9630308.1 HAMP domain-containing histidine kinase [Vibrio sp. Isolate30]